MVVTNSLSGGGAERSMNLVCNELVSRGWPISLVPINSGPQDQVVPKCPVFPLGRQWRDGILGTFFSLWKFNKVVRVWKPDVIVLNCDLPELFGATACGKQILVVVEHASNPWFQRKTFGKIVRRILVLRKTIWVSVSSHLSIWATNQTPIAVLQNPIIHETATKPRKVGNSIKRLVFIGRLSVEKQPELAMKIAQLARLPLLMIGDGGLRANLEARTIQESIRVTFTGQLGNPWAEIQSEDLLILTSTSEGDGLVIVEAIQRQVPLLVTDIPDLRRFGFPEKNYGKNEDDFAKKINFYLNDLKELLIPPEISTVILASRSISIIGDNWEKVLNQFD
jgi:glycosyltransferase involved in cell wall biosynthesis